MEISKHAFTHLNGPITIELQTQTTEGHLPETQMASIPDTRPQDDFI